MERTVEREEKRRGIIRTVNKKYGGKTECKEKKKMDMQENEGKCFFRWLKNELFLSLKVLDKKREREILNIICEFDTVAFMGLCITNTNTFENVFILLVRTINSCVCQQ